MQRSWGILRRPVRDLECSEGVKDLSRENGNRRGWWYLSCLSQRFPATITEDWAWGGQIYRVKFWLGKGEKEESGFIFIWASLYHTMASWAIALPEKQKLGPEESTTITITYHAGPMHSVRDCEMGRVWEQSILVWIIKEGSPGLRMPGFSSAVEMCVLWNVT